MSKIRGADELEVDNQATDDFDFPDAPYHADARTGHFGKGSKSAGFYYGDKLAVHTKSSKKDGGRVLIMELSGKKFDEKMQKGQDWQEQDILSRRSDDRKSREASIPRWDSLLQLMEELDSCESYTLFLISDIREQRREELRLEDIPAMASELRDMFMVYTDGIAIGLDGLGPKIALCGSRRKIASRTHLPSSSTPSCTSTSLRTKCVLATARSASGASHCATTRPPSTGRRANGTGTSSGASTGWVDGRAAHCPRWTLWSASSTTRTM